MEIYREYLLKSEKEKIPFKVPQRSHVVQNPKKNRDGKIREKRVLQRIRRPFEITLKRNKWQIENKTK